MDQKKEEKDIFIEQDWIFIERLSHTSLIQAGMKEQWNMLTGNAPDKNIEERIRNRIMQETGIGSNNSSEV